jgi:hypothetical protein
MGRKFSVRILPSRDAIYRTVKQAEERGSMCDQSSTGRKRRAEQHICSNVRAYRCSMGGNNKSKKQCDAYRNRLTA